ncbi:ribosome maturation factor RimM [Arenibaculum sp.]|jgi:16S rRNA processing protein RimM|uniref:ribosome maturation factor RimM n=1 Tax=Arenibaculum sp. TaxID=2865862 RepID=UPI002E16857C|nr:ribosome maturation factor RimM [Arenibaculum sp.]HEV7372871.1 ribosome maturation factor RimM [Arenibaculum sp.]
MTGSERVCVGQITGAHGVRGLVKLKSFTGDPAAIGGYDPLTDGSGKRVFRVRLMSAAKDHWIARIEGVDDRNVAEALSGTCLYVERSRLPEPEEDEFYHADLIGLPAFLPDGTRFGEVVALHDFGAGDVMEVRMAAEGTAMVPFTRKAVPVVDPRGGRVIVDPPAGLLDPASPSGEGAGEGGEEVS